MFAGQMPICIMLPPSLPPSLTPSHSLTYSMVGSDFAAAAVLITFGAVLGKASPFQMIIIAFFELMFYSANEAMNKYVLHAADVGGSMLIHTFGAYFGIAVSFVLYRKKAWDHPKNSSVYHSDLFAMIGEFCFIYGVVVIFIPAHLWPLHCRIQAQFMLQLLEQFTVDMSFSGF